MATQKRSKQEEPWEEVWRFDPQRGYELVDSYKVSRREFLQGVSGVLVGAALGGGAIAEQTAKKRKLAGKPKASTTSKTPRSEIQGSKREIPITLKVNGKEYRLRLEPRVTLLDTLRERLKLTGAKRVCDRGSCGCCTVLLDGKPVYSCMMLAVDAQVHEIVTVEGIASPEQLHPLQRAFVEQDALMCGFCTPGFVMALYALLQRHPNPTETQVKEAIRGNLCRCGTYPRIVQAALEVAKQTK